MLADQPHVTPVEREAQSRTGAPNTRRYWSRLKSRRKPSREMSPASRPEARSRVEPQRSAEAVDLVNGRRKAMCEAVCEDCTTKIRPGPIVEPEILMGAPAFR